MGRPAMSGREVYAIHAACIRGVEAFPVTVEVSMAEGIPGITIVGLLSDDNSVAQLNPVVQIRFD